LMSCAAHAALVRDGVTAPGRDELFRAAHDIKGDAATFGFPSAGVAAESLCRIIEHAPNFDQVPAELIRHHVEAIQAIVREHNTIEKAGVAKELSRRLRNVADDYLMHVNKDRPEHLEAIAAPSVVPAD
jgi:chemotaxis protein histidine kinase CheA